MVVELGTGCVQLSDFFPSRIDKGFVKNTEESNERYTLELGAFIREGGFASFLVVCVAIAAAAIAVERWIRIQFQYSVNSRAFMAKLKKYILSDNIDRAISLCNSKPQALLPKVLKAGLTRAKDSVHDIQNAIDEATLEVMPKLEARALYLPTFANLATLIGLFGTILGLILAFQELR